MPIPLPIPAMPWLMNRPGSDPDSAFHCVPRTLFRTHHRTLTFRPSTGALTADELARLGPAVAAVGGLVSVYWWECPIGVEHYSVREAARWAVYWDQSCADRAAHRAALVRLRPRMSARTDEGISEASWNMAAMRAVDGWMPRWTSCPRMFSVARCLPGMPPGNSQWSGLLA